MLVWLSLRSYRSNNCHHHTAAALRYMGLRMSMMGIWAEMAMKAKFVSFKSVVYTFWGWIVILIIVLLSLYV